MQRQAAFHIPELDCAAEAAVLRRELESLAGVTGLEFDVVQARMTVRYDDVLVQPRAIIARVTATGMHANPADRRQAVDAVEPWWTSLQFWACAVSGGSIAIKLAVDAWRVGSFSQVWQGDDVPGSSRTTYLIPIVVAMWYVLRRAAAALRRMRPDMNLLMTIAVIGAWLIGEALEAAMTAWLFSVALLLERWSMDRTRRAIAALLDLTPPTARVRREPDGTIDVLPVECVAVGATVVVRPGERFPLDGEVLTGRSSVNEAPISGESAPVEKQPGHEVFAGTINGDGVIEFRVTRPANDTTLARMVHLVQEAQSRRSPSQQWVDRFAVVYTPIMLALAVGIVAVPPLVQTLSGHDAAWLTWLYRGLVVLVIACPCALVISTPVSLVSALTTAVRRGVLVKGGLHLETAAHVSAVALDKTGTLTHGHPEVHSIVPFNGHTSRQLVERAAALESHSTHPLARAIMRRATSDAVSIPNADDVRSLSGRGVAGTFDGRPFWIGSHRLMHEQGGETDEIHQRAIALEDAGHTVVAVGNAEHVCGLISIADQVRSNACDAVRQLRSLGVRPIVLVTGDSQQTAREVARLADVDAWHAELLPEDKLRLIEDLNAQHGTVAMIGDGVNDASAMAASALGVAMGEVGTAAAIETADVVLMADDLTRLPWLIRHARRTLATVRINVTFALGLKAVFVLLTLLGWASLWAAIVADTGATLLVIFNGLRLLRESRVDS
jgi:Cd2+/Zn2+-exporting ATPase